MWHGRNPEVGPLYETTDNLKQPIKGRIDYRGPDDEHEVPATGDVRVYLTDGFAYAPLGPIAVVRFAKLLANHEATPSPSGAVPRGIKAEPRM